MLKNTEAVICFILFSNQFSDCFLWQLYAIVVRFCLNLMEIQN